MTKKPLKNIASSIRQRLLDISRQQKVDFNYLLNRFANERFLYRFSQSSHATLFIIKGAFLFLIWTGTSHRPTRDIDFLALEDLNFERYMGIFKEVCDISSDDGIIFNRESVTAEAIRDNQAYGGIRIFVEGALTNARFRLQFDIGFGDEVTPESPIIEIPSLLNFPSPWMRIYPKETLISEKYEALVKLGIINSRMKDFYDLWYLSHHFAFDGEILSRAIQSTFRRRKTPLPQSLPTALTDEFADDSDKKKQWKAFISQKELEQNVLALHDVITRLKLFLIPPTKTLLEGKSFKRKWDPETGWV